MIKGLTKYCLFFLFLFCGTLIYGQDTCKCRRSWITPRFVTLQYAGGIGNYVIGPGYYINKSGSLQLGILYGFTPKYKANTSINTLSLKFVATIFKIKIKDHYLAPIAGLGVSHIFGDGNKTFFRLPEVYPEDYYAPSSIRMHLNLGGKFRYNFKKKWFIHGVELYVETTTNDLYLKYYYSYKAIKINQIFTMDIGVNIYID